ncbi:PAS domain-containing protein [Streptomyces neyagawaensis]|uniref:PAS domain-containing protein n=1 Tax=Streptomyces neyagawaensis TaxID=42238 RepID=A0ABV3B2K9_9ACTN
MTEDTTASGWLSPKVLAAARSVDAVFATDGRGSVTQWSASAQRLWGWSRQEAVGLELADLYTADGVARHKDGHTFDAPTQITALTGSPRSGATRAFVRCGESACRASRRRGDPSEGP